MSRYSKYYVTLCIVFLFTVTWFIGSPLDWLIWVPVAFLVLIYVPMSYEIAIERANILKGIFYSLREFLSSLLIFSIVALLAGTVGSILILPYLPELAPIIVPDFRIFVPEGDTTKFLLWNFASFNAVILLWAELEDRKKEIEKKEDSSPEQEE